MRIGILLPFKDHGGPPLDSEGLAARARMVEDAGLDGVWMGDASFRGMAPWPDPLMWLLAAAVATERVEVGTAIYQVPLRPATDLAQRFLTLHGLTNGRLTLGVGAGSTAADFQAVGVPYEDRFQTFYRHMRTIRKLCSGETGGPLTPRPSIAGGPRFLLGAWYREVSLRRAVSEYDGWLCSARTPYATMVRAIERYRELGGTRTIVATCPVDLDGPEQPLRPDEPFSLRCRPAEARDRLHRLAELGVDDILLSIRDPERPGPFEGDITPERVEAVRALLPKDRPVATWSVRPNSRDPVSAHRVGMPRGRGAPPARRGRRGPGWSGGAAGPPP